MPNLTMEQIWPPFVLRIEAGPLSLSPVQDADIPDLVALIRAGLHEPGAMPFTQPCTEAPPDRLPALTAAYYWRTRAEFTPARWTVDFVVRHHGSVVGIQGIMTNDFAVTRSAETGSWLGRAFHRQGIGTLMRQAVCAFLFDHLDAAEITSAAFEDNPASAAVSRKVGYEANGVARVQRREGELALSRRLRLTPERFRRGPDPLTVSGLVAFRDFVGLKGRTR